MRSTMTIVHASDSMCLLIFGSLFLMSSEFLDLSISYFVFGRSHLESIFFSGGLSQVFLINLGLDKIREAMYYTSTFSHVTLLLRRMV